MGQLTDQFFDSNGVNIRYVHQGEGEPVILVHGFVYGLRGFIADRAPSEPSGAPVT